MYRQGLYRTLVRLVDFLMCAKSVRNRISKPDLKYRTPRNGSFFMTELSNQYIEDAFLKIRSHVREAKQ